VTVKRAGDDALLSVRDTGVGMAPELAERVFDLFVQGNPTLDRGHGGLGIGLTLVRRLAELHGGAAAAASAGRGRGSEFTVRLPSIAQPALRSSEKTLPAKVERRDILIVEDNPDAAETLRKLLELSGHRVRIERDGVAGLQALLARPPQIALIDIGLPRMDGYELVRRARAGLDGFEPPFMVAVTGYGLPEDRRRALDSGFDEHVTKPVDYAALQAVLKKGRG
jgi:CheY-like chemotaxis protein